MGQANHHHQALTLLCSVALLACKSEVGESAASEETVSAQRLTPMGCRPPEDSINHRSDWSDGEAADYVASQRKWHGLIDGLATESLSCADTNAWICRSVEMAAALSGDMYADDLCRKQAQTFASGSSAAACADLISIIEREVREFTRSPEPGWCPYIFALAATRRLGDLLPWGVVPKQLDDCDRMRVFCMRVSHSNPSPASAQVMICDQFIDALLQAQSTVGRIDQQVTGQAAENMRRQVNQAMKATCSVLVRHAH